MQIETWRNFVASLEISLDRLKDKDVEVSEIEWFDPVPLEQVEELERELEFPLPGNFRQFLKLTGGFRFDWFTESSPFPFVEYGGNSEVDFLRASSELSLAEVYREFLGLHEGYGVKDEVQTSLIRRCFPLYLADLSGNALVIRLDTEPLEVHLLKSELAWHISSESADSNRSLVGVGLTEFLINWAALGGPATENLSEFVDACGGQVLDATSPAGIAVKDWLSLPSSSMKNHHSWIWNERQQIGKDYASPEEVAVYDESHSKFRDVVGEFNTVLDSLNVSSGQSLLDIGCGTGVLARLAAGRGLAVTATDVSTTMLEYARRQSEGLPIRFVPSGFLTLELDSESQDFITTSLALHHLPDFYKWLALKRLRNWIKPDGRMFIQDVVIAFENCTENIDQFITQQEALGGDFLRKDAIQHFQEEFSTFDWIMEGLLSRAGWQIEDKSTKQGLFACYLCQPV